MGTILSEHALPSILINDFSENDILRLTDLYKKASTYLNKTDTKKIQKLIPYHFMLMKVS